MSLYSDFVAFLDAGAVVPYFFDGAHYIPKPELIHEELRFDFKVYFRSFNRYFVGIDGRLLVREITAQDYKRVFALVNKEPIKKAIQLFLEF